MRSLRLSSLMLGLLAAVTLCLVPLTSGVARAGAGQTNTVTGTVSFADGSPAAGAYVSIRADPFLSAIADGNGQYTISGIEDGFAMVDATISSGGLLYSGSAFVGFAPGGGSTATADITVHANFFPPGPGF